MSAVVLTVNGRRLQAEVRPRTHLADLLREAHDLTGTHTGCEHGVCGACTVLVDGAPVRSCITYAVACDAAEVTTIEGLDADEIAGELREAFSREHGLQCGYCTPGMIVAARDLVLRLDAPSEREIRVAMSGNLCRCTGYVGIIRAIGGVIAARRARGIPAVPGGGRVRLGPAGSGNAAALSATAPASLDSPAAASPAVPKLDADWTPQTVLQQSLAVSHPPAAVWAFFERVADVAACLPGATIDSVSPEGRVSGRIRVKAGPIAATFAGVADVSRDERTRTGVINGAGRDAKSNTATRGLIRYKVAEAGTGTSIAVEVGFTLTGMLAQFGRSGLVQDVAARLTVAFAQNLEARLAPGADSNAPLPVARLDAGALLLAAARGWVRAAMHRLLRRDV